MAEWRTYVVRVRYEVERTVYVEAYSAASAGRFARDTSEWRDADQPHEDVETIRVLRDQTSPHERGEVDGV